MHHLNSYGLHLFGGNVQSAVFLIQAYSNQLPTPEQLSLRKNYRQRIMKSQGYYIPDPDARSPSWKE